jgi:hypothetical protein
MADSSASALVGITAANAAQLRDDATATAWHLEEEALAARATNTARAAQLQQEATLLKDAAATQERVRVAANALSKERAQAGNQEAQAATIRERLRLEAAPGSDPEDGNDDSISFEATVVAHLQS